LIVGSSVLGLEIEDGTITHVLSKPVRRSEIIVAKLVVGWAVTTVSTAVPVAIAGMITDSAGLGISLLVAVAVGALAYTAIFLALSLMSRRPVAVGLIYIVLWENLLTSFVGGTQVLSIKQYTTAIADGLVNTPLLKGNLSIVTPSSRSRLSHWARPSPRSDCVPSPSQVKPADTRFGVSLLNGTALRCLVVRWVAVRTRR
jgi:ABC-2 type transport system permease protein